MKLVILDRDGVINCDSDHYVKSADEFVLIEGSAEAIAKLHQAGFTVVVATNQSGLSRGLFDLDDLEAMHDKLQQAVEQAGGELAGIFYCPHGPDDDCPCRKPRAGLIDAIEAELEICAAGSPLVGDSLRDLEAGLKKGCEPILVKTGKGERTLAKLADSDNERFQNLPVFTNLQQAVLYILDQYASPDSRE
ncbi:D-glycero-beta-D-manno-heptose 1,7-bisphosphate 7-phosphatase [Pseudomaricurvus alkylphenolicus]|uniref:D-glycero-beta-D-manno-heptose 1,7-bisphosphate 7-phosphatase n=1 Tax=Pseudomaricurvus alkylphenolicus TaxID=1306991 RepID=UPI00142442BA|nr:D-glycero-beta-D-manno-heptose 1,7-bisphosphate 7-phosphatase [Pseudomaricurvus alkylphenolicus]NIB39501.1 D-glycero-beta-D-manno-heptose 1,7-bisphosphate 7-phosphatase [Pseudomaricurvus alkylphenolicus]